MKTPKRLKPLIGPSGLIFRIVKSAASDRTNEILQKSCPKKYQNQGLTEEEKLSVVELIEPSQASHTRLSSPFQTCTDQVTESKSKTSCADTKPKFNQFVCSYYEVESYIWGMIHSLGLGNWWGDSSKNEDVVRENITHIIKLRKFEKISLHQLVQDMTMKDCHCLIGSITDITSRAMFHDFVWWFYESFICSLIKVLPSSFERKIVFFKTAWLY
ncbi:uncharacterized protein MELLADRAFT_66061 [Melampsora larici-populina 98AG31]|uniref:Telomerase reverse transcriptase n=1 Tax=Melampsora larici-populina (strain 98AG31 / pathotype 3-4-7) TaxID=747676 RepID=F4RXQ9_MELLP|nr:uncharacterized protein MELLADRAFT_66061 [Melampsora larici-populina 98AG31]EGG02772.1 hypothetical protein MELLADRAFT_66061 [Melampsora larici-populina 98AG31]